MAKNTPAGGSDKKKKNKNKMKNKVGFLSTGVKKSKEAKENPFESIWSKRKFDILGKKRKNDERRRVGLSRSLALNKREKTLLKEYVQSTKSSTFVDKRIGEQNEELGDFDKAILRSQRERQSKLKRKSKYNLSDGEEDDFDFPEGPYFPDRDDFDEEVPDEEEAGQLSRTGNPNEGEHGMDSRSSGQENRPKTKKEVMKDVMLKSKFYKAEKAKDKEETEQISEQLDKNFTSLVQSGDLVALTQPNKIKALKALVNNHTLNGNAKTEELTGTSNKVSVEQGKSDDYDKLVSELGLEIRARPSDRTKTAEELAQEEKERLERLEEERLKRMGITDDLGDEGAESFGEEDDESDKQNRHISGDDLGDSLTNDAVSRNKVVWIDDITGSGMADGHVIETSLNSGDSENDDDGEEEEEEEDNTGGSAEDDDEGKKNHSLKDWEQSDDEYVENDPEEEEEADACDDKLEDASTQKILSQITHKRKECPGYNKINSNLKETLDRKRELPYTIEAPRNFEELSALFENRSDDQIVEAISRIRAFNAISIAAENRKKMQVFYGVLLQYFATLATKKPLNFSLLNLLVKPLMEISAEIPYFAAICARQRLLHTRNQFCEDLKNAGNSCWPSLKTLLLLRLWSMVFPCSDFRHAVMTPAILLMSEYLMRCRINSGRDIAVGSFLCSMVLSASRQSQRFCPEAITFIQTMLMAALKNSQIIESSQLFHLMELKTLSQLLRLEGHVKGIRSLDFLALMELPDDSSYFTSGDFRASMLSAILGNLRGFVDIYHGLKSFPEIFPPILKILHGLANEDQTPETLKDVIKDIAQNIADKCAECYLVRLPLRYQKVKVLKTIAPKFEDNFVKGRDYDPDRERAEMKKLKKRLKQEAKGAARELRKDNYFLLEVKDRDRARAAEEKAEKYGKHLAFLQEQEHAFKSGQWGKGKGRKRRK